MKEEQLSDLHAQLTRVKTKVQTELESSQQNAVKIGESMDKVRCHNVALLSAEATLSKLCVLVKSLTQFSVSLR